MARLVKKRFLVLDVAITILAISLAVICAWEFILKPNASPLRPSVPVDTKVLVAGFDFQGSPETILLVLQKDCRFCSMSAPFYKRLLAKSSGNQNLRLVAALPHPPEVSRRYLESLELFVNDVREVDFAEVKVPATPTLLLVNNEGRIKASWVGMLSRDDEEEVLQRIDRAKGRY